MENNDFELKRTYSIYQSSNEKPLVLVSIYSKGHLISQRNISRKELEYIAKLAKNSNDTSITVDQKSFSRLLQFNNFPLSITWIVPAKERNLLVVGGEPYKTDVPDLMFTVNGGTLMVYFVTVKDGNYMIAKCSYPNVYDNHVCLGNVKIPATKKLLSEEMEKWEDLFFNSSFTSSDFKVPEIINYQKANWL